MTMSPPNNSQITFDQLSSQCSDTKMTINSVKSKILRLNLLKRNFVPPEVPFPVVSEVKILGVIFSHDWTFTTHINSVTWKEKVFLQTLSKMRPFGCNAHSLLQAYLCYLHPILQYACPVWGSSVLKTTYVMQELESVQKWAARIILSNRDISYLDALAPLNSKVWNSVWGSLSGGLAKCYCLTLLTVIFYHQKPWQSSIQDRS